MYSLFECLLEKSKLAQHAYKNGHKICWKEAKVLQTEPDTTYRKYKQSAHMSLVDHPISQPSLDISPIWTPVIAAEVRKLQLCPMYTERKNCVFIFILVPYREFISLVITFVLIVL
jgi:hypothetical protein